MSLSIISQFSSHKSCNIGMAPPGWKGHFRIFLMVIYRIWDLLKHRRLVLATRHSFSHVPDRYE